MSWPVKGASVRAMISQAGTGVGSVLSPLPPPGLSYSGQQWYRNGTAIAAGSGGTAATYTLTSGDVPAVGGADILFTVELTGLTVVSLALASSNPAIAASVVAAPVINGVPTVGTPLSITAGTFSGANPAATITRVIRANGVQVASGSGSTTYTPVTADIGSTFTVTDTATNSAGATPNPSAASAPCVAGVVSTADTSHALKGAAFNSTTFN